MDNLVSMKQMARILGVGYRNFLYMAKREEIPYIWVGKRRRFDPEEVKAHLRGKGEDSEN